MVVTGSVVALAVVFCSSLAVEDFDVSVVVVPCAPLSVDDSGGKMVVVSCAPLSVEVLVVIKVVVSCLTLVDIRVVVCRLSVLLMRLVLVLTFSVVSGTTDVISNVVTIVWLLVVEEFNMDEVEELSISSVVAIGCFVDDDILCDNVVPMIDEVVSSFSVVDGNA